MKQETLTNLLYEELAEQDYKFLVHILIDVLNREEKETIAWSSKAKLKHTAFKLKLRELSNYYCRLDEKEDKRQCSKMRT